jgi:cathepsin L
MAQSLHMAKLAMVPRPLAMSGMSTPALYAAWRSTYAPRTMLAEASPLQAAAAYATFSKTVDMVKAHNSGPNSQYYTLTLNRFADTPPRVFKRRFGFRMNPKRFPKTVSPMLAMSIRAQTPIPSEADWRLMTSVTNVKDQGSCGSCWAFSATAALEGFYARTTGKLVSFSTQPFIDCVMPSTNGCNGGEPADVFQYVIADGKGKVCSFATEKYTGESSSSSLDQWGDDVMPYLKKRRDDDDMSPYDGDSGGGGCNYQACTVGVNPKAMHTIPVNDSDTLEQREDAFMRALVEHGPISAAVASQESWSSYEKGVLLPKQAYSPNDLNHAVLLVGYGVDPSGKGYWTVKNSWASSWGEGGYFRLPRGNAWKSQKTWDKNGPFGMLSYSSPYLV